MTDISVPILDDPRYTESVRQIIIHEIEKGNTPEGAAAQANITRATHNKWMETPEYSEWLNRLVDLHNGGIRKTIESVTGEIVDPKDQAQTLMKHLAAIDPDYGTKRLDITDEREKKTERVDNAAEFQELQKQAEAAANGTKPA